MHIAAGPHEVDRRYPLHTELWVALGTTLPACLVVAPGRRKSALRSACVRPLDAAFHRAKAAGADALHAWWTEGRVEVEYSSSAPGTPLPGARIVGGRSLDFAAGTPAGWLRVVAKDAVGPRRTGFWAAMLAAQTLAELWGGQVVDPSRRGLGPAFVTRARPPDDRVHVGRHLSVPASFGSDRLAWLTTLGLGKFGLPELELRHVAPALVEAAARVMAGVGQRLLDTTHPIPRAARHRCELRLSDLQWAIGLEGGASGQAVAVIELREGRLGHPFGRRLVLEPPPGELGPRATWPQRILRRLVGPAPGAGGGGDGADTDLDTPAQARSNARR